MFSCPLKDELDTRTHFTQKIRFVCGDSHLETLWYFASGRVSVYFMTKMKICVPTEHVLRWDLYDLTCAVAGTGALWLEIGHNVNSERWSRGENVMNSWGRVALTSVAFV